MKLLEDTIKTHLNKIEFKGATSSIKYNKAMPLFKVGETSLGSKGSIKRITLRIPRLHIKTSSNNTVMTLTDYKGNVVLSCSAGNLMFKGAKRSTPYAAESVALKIKKYLQQHKYKNLRILVNGVNKNNYTIMKKISTIRLKKINIKSLQNTTPVPHNGCRKAKKRRL
jgi:small subunit ribosomal protein S11